MQDVVKLDTLFKISVFETDILWISFYGSIHVRLRCAIQAIIAITVEKNLQSSLYFAVKKTNIIGRKDLFNQFKVYLFFKTNDVVLYV